MIDFEFQLNREAPLDDHCDDVDVTHVFECQSSFNQEGPNSYLKESMQMLNAIEGIDTTNSIKDLDKLRVEVWRTLFLEMSESRRRNCIGFKVIYYISS